MKNKNRKHFFILQTLSEGLTQGGGGFIAGRGEVTAGRRGFTSGFKRQGGLVGGDSGDGDLATADGGRFCTVKWSTVGACCGALGAGREAGDSCGLEKEVLYPPKRCHFDAEIFFKQFETNQTVRSETADSSGSAGPIPVQPVSSLINQNRDRQAVGPAGLFRFLKPWFLNLLIFYPLRPGSSDKGLGWVCGRCQVQVPAGSKRDKLLHYIHSTKSKTFPVFLHNRSSNDAIVLTIRYLSHL